MSKKLITTLDQLLSFKHRTLTGEVVPGELDVYTTNKGFVNNVIIKSDKLGLKIYDELLNFEFESSNNKSYLLDIEINILMDVIFTHYVEDKSNKAFELYYSPDSNLLDMYIYVRNLDGTKLGADEEVLIDKEFRKKFLDNELKKYINMDNIKYIFTYN